MNKLNEGSLLTLELKLAGIAGEQEEKQVMQQIGVPSV